MFVCKNTFVPSSSPYEDKLSREALVGVFNTLTCGSLSGRKLLCEAVRGLWSQSFLQDLSVVLIHVHQMSAS